MIELLRSWLVGITCAAMAVALAESLAPNGAVRKVGRLTGGLVILLALLQPIVTLDMTNLSGILAEYRVEAAGYSDHLEGENEKLMKAIIAEQTGAYILDKAAVLGIGSCEVTVQVADREKGYPTPESVTVMGSITEDQQKILSRQIEANLAISADRQTYIARTE